jgi:oxygen-independent coproporphyrinogen-3 oxidase
MMNALRLNNGFETRLFSERTGIPWEAMSMRLAEASNKDLITINHDWIQPTLRGRRYLNELLQIFLD